jgi:hypothetical protein
MICGHRPGSPDRARPCRRSPVAHGPTQPTSVCRDRHAPLHHFQFRASEKRGTPLQSRSPCSDGATEGSGRIARRVRTLLLTMLRRQLCRTIALIATYMIALQTLPDLDAVWPAGDADVVICRIDSPSMPPHQPSPRHHEPVCPCALFCAMGVCAYAGRAERRPGQVARFVVGRPALLCPLQLPRSLRGPIVRRLTARIEPSMLAASAAWGERPVVTEPSP